MQRASEYRNISDILDHYFNGPSSLSSSVARNGRLFTFTVKTRLVILL